jgi:hypothetical protein
MNNLFENFPKFNFIFDYSEDIRRTVNLINQIDDKLSSKLKFV